jgi:hypothetical protein
MVTASRTDHPEPPHGEPGNSSSPPPGNPFEPVIKKLAELLEYATQYAAIRQDQVKATVRRLIVKAVIGLFVAVLGVMALLTAVVLLMVGLAGWVGSLLGRPELGYIVVGGGLCLLAAIGLVVGLQQWGAWSRRKTLQKYERRHAKQRAAFSQDVVERAARGRRPV